MGIRFPPYATKNEILAVAGEILGLLPVKEMSVTGWGCSIIMDVLYRFSGLKSKQIGNFGIDYSTVSQGCKRLRERKVWNKDAYELVERIDPPFHPII